MSVARLPALICAPAMAGGHFFPARRACVLLRSTLDTKSQFVVTHLVMSAKIPEHDIHLHNLFGFRKVFVAKIQSLLYRA